jgi:hypothetical protein
MKSKTSSTLRSGLATLLLLVGIIIGYLAPHGHEAFASTPSPHPMFSDGTPGGFGHGLVTIHNASAVGLTASKAGWPCLKSDKCTFEFQFDTSDSGVPEIPTCPSAKQSCLQFSGQNYTFETHGPSSFGPKDVYIAGSLQFYK